MVAYSFQPRFVEPIEAGIKRHTIRAERKRHAREGEELQLFTGMRTRACKRIGTATCLGTAPIRLDFDSGRVEYLNTGTAWTTAAELDAFAVSDGFADWPEMAAFWLKHHPGIRGVFQGVLVLWGPSFKASK